MPMNTMKEILARGKGWLNDHDKPARFPYTSILFAKYQVFGARLSGRVELLEDRGSAASNDIPQRCLRTRLEF